MKKLLLLVVLVAIAFFAVYVWPTPWDMQTVRSEGIDRIVRLHRFDGRIEVLTKYGWKPMNSSEPTAMDRAIAILER